MKIVADSNIPFAAAACATLGEVEVVKAGELSAERLRDCDVLLCRSTRTINAELLDGTRVRFVATATIGTDHMDFEYLNRRGIVTASAPGSNADSVSEWLVSVLFALAERLGRRLRDMSIGVVGVGNVGSRVVKKAEALGMTVLQNDPPLRRRTGDERFRPIGELMAADILTLHVPLTQEGRDATYHMADRAFLNRMKPGAVLINSSRGAVADSGALHAALDAGTLGAAALDVWENEPLIDASLLGKVSIGTAHIAGHSFDGKVNGTKMIYDALCEFLGVPAEWEPAEVMPPPAVDRLAPDAAGRDDEDVVCEVVRELYDVRRDDAELRNIPDGGTRGEQFSSLRRDYWPRREFRHTSVAPVGGSPRLRSTLAGLGFKA